MERKLTRSFALSVLQIIHTRLLVHNCMHRINLNWLYFHPVKILLDRKSTRLNSSHSQISYAVFCLKKKKQNNFLELPELRSSMTPFCVYVLPPLPTCVPALPPTCFPDLNSTSRQLESYDYT